MKGIHKIGLSRKSALNLASAPTSLEFVNRYFTADPHAASDVIVEYADSPILLDEKITVLAYCSRHKSEWHAERAAWVLCDLLRGSMHLIRRSRKKAHCHIRWLRNCRRKCRTNPAREFLRISLFQLGDKASCTKFVDDIINRHTQYWINPLNVDKFAGLRTMTGLARLYGLNSRNGNRALVQMGRFTKRQWIKITVGAMLLFNGCSSGLVFLLQEKGNVPNQKSHKYMLLFGLAWGGVHEAAEEFQQIATEENEHIGLSIIYTLCRTYGFKSQSSCKFFEDVQKTVESRIDPDRLKALRELS